MTATDAGLDKDSLMAKGQLERALDQPMKLNISNRLLYIVANCTDLNSLTMLSG